jgi:uncharacterized membrane protein YfcA
MLTIFLASIALGLIAGLLAGLFGIGGGLVIVPVLMLLLDAQQMPEHLLILIAVATSLATIVLTAIASVAAHHRLGAVIWAKVWRLSPLIMVGAGAGAVLAQKISAVGLRYILVVFLLVVGTQLALAIKPKTSVLPSSWLLDSLVALLIGLLSAIVGIGGGTLTVPYLLASGFQMRHAVAVASACGLPIALAGTLSYALLGQQVDGLPEWSLGYVYLPAFCGISLGSLVTAGIGARWANRLPAATLKRYFSLLLFLMAAKLLWH